MLFQHVSTVSGVRMPCLYLIAIGWAIFAWPAFAQKMFWIGSGTNKFQCANLDGTGKEVLVSTGLHFPLGLALDLPSGKMYWTDDSIGKIQRANLDGSDVEDLVVGVEGVAGIAFNFPGALPVAANSLLGLSLLSIVVILLGGAAVKYGSTKRPLKT